MSANDPHRPRRKGRLRRAVMRGGAALAAMTLVTLPGTAPAYAAYGQIEGTGSTWSQIIVDQWIADGMFRPKRLKMAKPAALAMAEASLIPLD